MKMLVVHKEKTEEDLVLHLTRINSKGKPILQGRNSLFVELWYPYTKTLDETTEEDITVFDVTITEDIAMSCKNRRKKERRNRNEEKQT